MGMLDFALHGSYGRFYQKLKEIGKQEHKSPILMFADAAISVIITGSGLSDYLNYKFYKKSYKERLTYVTIGYQYSFYKRIVYNVSANYDNKLAFLRQFKEFAKRDYYDPNDGLEGLKDFIEKHHEFVIKPFDGLGGTNVRKTSIDEFGSVEALHKHMLTNRMFVEELIVQDDNWGKISPNSTNTIRVMTSVVNDHANVFCIMARIGNGKQIADNFHQGGVGVAVDIQRECLIGKGVDKNNDTFENSVANVKFDGFAVPYLKETIAMCEKLALANKDIHVVGWDIALTNKGPVVIEGNAGPGFDLIQVVYDKGTKYMLEAIKDEMKQAHLW